MEISAKLVKELRDRTGAGMMECKKALQEADGNLPEAEIILRKRGLSSAAKKAGRATPTPISALESVFINLGAAFELGNLSMILGDGLARVV